MKYRMSTQYSLGFDELIVDNFAGGGGGSTGIEQAIGRPVDIAINHDPDAIAMHTINHPTTKHYCESVWAVNPREVTQGRPVGLAWFSPDCKHFSKAKGGTPVAKEIRGLAWVAVRWAATVKPRIIMLENVEEFMTWGPVVDGKPCPNGKGKTFQHFVHSLKSLGYQVEYKTLRASDFGTPTIRKRFFLIARSDGQPVVWPQPTHGDPSAKGFKKSGLKKWKTAADIIDWSIPCPSIFDRKKPLAENTLRRIARGLERFVFENPQPFIVRIGQQGFGKDGMQYGIDVPLTTITTKNEHLVIIPNISTYYGAKSNKEVRGSDLREPIATQTTENRFALVTTFLAKHFGGNYSGPGVRFAEPLHTVTAVDHHALVTSYLVHMRNNCDAKSLGSPLPTLTAGGGHVGEVRAFLIKYYGTGAIGQSIDSPLHTVTSKERIGLVVIRGELYQIVDICMRMLEPHELYAATGFPKNYRFNEDFLGNPIPKYKQTARCGNAVPPPLAYALVSANYSNQILNQVA